MLTYRCRKTARAPKLDGAIDPAIWGQAEPVALMHTVTGEAPVQATEARMLYDDENLYVAFHCIDHEAWGSMMNSDDPIFREEVVEIFIDAAARQRGYVEIEVSPHNTVLDLYIMRNMLTGTYQALSQWDCIGLRTAVHVERERTERGYRGLYWNCEMAIPFHQINDAPHNPPRPGDRWRVNLYRIDRDNQRDEHTAWSPTKVMSFHQPDRFGTLLFLPADGK